MKNELISKNKRILLLCVYFFGYLFLYQYVISAYAYRQFGMSGYLIGDALMNAFMIIFFSLVLNDWLKKQWQKFRERTAHSMKWVFITVVLLYISIILFFIFIASPMHLGESDNEANNNLLMQMDLIGYLFGALIMAPFVEEVIFRGCIYQPIAAEHGFLKGALTTGLCFGALHIMATVGSGAWINLLYIIVYGMCGFILAVPFYKTNSIWTSVFAHAVYNAFSIIVSLI